MMSAPCALRISSPASVPQLAATRAPAIFASSIVGMPTPPEPPKAPEAAAPPPVSPDTSALQDIVVRQALRINELEAEVAALKAKAAKPAKAKPQSKAKPRPAKA